MARFNPFKRVTDAIKRIVAPSPPRREPPRREPPRREEPTRHDRIGAEREIWRETVHRKANYRKNLEAFHAAVDPIEPDPQEQLILWRSYIRNIVNGEGQFRRNDTANLFWRDSGVDPGNFNWAAWREAMGFTGKRRSRTP